MTDVDVRGWDQTASVEMINSDTATIRNLEIFVRYVPEMVGDSIKLTINTIAPDSTSYDEEITIHFDTQISDRYKGVIGRYPYRKHSLLRQMGSYTVEITPTAEVRGVEAIGINTERTE